MAEPQQHIDLSEILLPEEEVSNNFRASMKYNIGMSDIGGGFDGVTFENTLSKYDICVATNQRLIFLSEGGEKKIIDGNTISSIDWREDSKLAATLDSVDTESQFPSLGIGGIISVAFGLFTMYFHTPLSILLITAGLVLIAWQVTSDESTSDGHYVSTEEISITTRDEPQLEMIVPLESQKKVGKELHSLLSG